MTIASVFFSQRHNDAKIADIATCRRVIALHFEIETHNGS